MKDGTIFDVTFGTPENVKSWRIDHNKVIIFL